jgi:hypothetical protein
MSTRTLRIEERPDPASWSADELLTLAEAAALFWPQGPLSESSLRTAVRDRRLAVTVIARKFLVTPAAIQEMSRCSLLSTPEAAVPNKPNTKNQEVDPWDKYRKQHKI